MKIKFLVNTDHLRDAEQAVYTASLPFIPQDFSGITRVVEVDPWVWTDMAGRQFWESYATVELIGTFDDPSADS